MEQLPRVVIVGGGFGGLYAAKRLAGAKVDLTLVDRRNFHLFQPLLYQVATGGLSPANIAAPLRAIFKKQQNTRVILAEVNGIDVAGRALLIGTERLPYDFLIVATGARHQYFGKHEWEKHAPGLKTVEDATEIRRRILLAFEEAEREQVPESRAAWMTFVVVWRWAYRRGTCWCSGRTGPSYLAGQLSFDRSRTIPESYCSKARTGFCRALPRCCRRKQPRRLGRLGVTVHTGATVTEVTDESVTYQSGDKSETVLARTVLWAAGVLASPLARQLAETTGARIDKAARVFVEPDLTLPGHPEIFVIGDMAHFPGPDGRPLPGVAPVAIQQGRYAADTIRARLLGRTVEPFRYFDKGSLAVIGRSAAVADLGWIRISGILAWIAWLTIHLLYLVAFSNRLLVLVQWAASYVTKNRYARLITGQPSAPPPGPSTGKSC